MPTTSLRREFDEAKRKRVIRDDGSLHFTRRLNLLPVSCRPAAKGGRATCKFLPDTDNLSSNSAHLQRPPSSSLVARPKKHGAAKPSKPSIWRVWTGFYENGLKMRIDEKLKRTRMAQDGRTGVSPSPSTDTTPGACPIPELRRLFDMMESGTVPNWLEVMSAVSAMVAFYTDCDSPSQCSVEKDFCRSQK